MSLVKELYIWRDKDFLFFSLVIRLLAGSAQIVGGMHYKVRLAEKVNLNFWIGMKPLFVEDIKEAEGWVINKVRLRKYCNCNVNSTFNV